MNPRRAPIIKLPFPHAAINTGNSLLALSFFYLSVNQICTKHLLCKWNRAWAAKKRRQERRSSGEDKTSLIVPCVGGKQSGRNPEEEINLSGWRAQGQLCGENTTMAGPWKMNMMILGLSRVFTRGMSALCDRNVTQMNLNKKRAFIGSQTGKSRGAADSKPSGIKDPRLWSKPSLFQFFF